MVLDIFLFPSISISNDNNSFSRDDDKSLDPNKYIDCMSCSNRGLIYFEA